VSDIRRLDYDQIAKMYATSRNASERVVSHIIQGMGGQSVNDLLEVGCGTGDHLFVLSGLFGANGHGFDKSAQMLEEGAKKNPGLDLRQDDASIGYPYSASEFDLVFSVNVIHYIKDLDHFFREAWRVLRPGGVVVTVTDSEEDIRNRIMSHYFPESAEIELRRYHPVATIERAMKDAGFVEAWSTHTEYTFAIGESQLNQFRNKAFSALRLLPEACFQQGMRRLEQDVQRGGCLGRELYTYVWGRKGANT